MCWYCRSENHRTINCPIIQGKDVVEIKKSEMKVDWFKVQWCANLKEVTK